MAQSTDQSHLEDCWYSLTNKLVRLGQQYNETAADQFEHLDATFKYGYAFRLGLPARFLELWYFFAWFMDAVGYTESYLSGTSAIFHLPGLLDLDDPGDYGRDTSLHYQIDSLVTDANILNAVGDPDQPLASAYRDA
jgi:hypothetical protein